jgi:endonuclease III
MMSLSTNPPSAEPSFALLSPPLSPLSSYDDELSVTVTDDLGMVVGYGSPTEGTAACEVWAVKERRPKKTRRKITYVSRHFSQSASRADGEESEASAAAGTPKPSKAKGKSAKKSKNAAAPPPGALATPPSTSAKTQGRVFYGLNVDELSSDSSLTSVPDSIGPDPFDPLASPEVVAVKTKDKQKSATKRKTKSANPTTSPYFPSLHKQRSHFLSTLPFPPLSAPAFGLMQERLAHDPFRLLLATIFLNKTPGERAIPVMYQLLERYPTPADLAGAEVGGVTEVIRRLGFQNQRARKIVAFAEMWIEKPPERGIRYRKVDYPVKGDGRDVKADEVLGEDDDRIGWEVAHLPGCGAYSVDSWRMFCRDTLLQKDTAAEGFEPEWKRVLPTDKELRAWMTWMWLKEGWVWDKETGERTKASEELMAMARGGGVVVEEKEKSVLTVQPMVVEAVLAKEKLGKVGRTAGEVLDEVKGKALGSG